MKSIHTYFMGLIMALSFFSCKDKPVETQNLFKFREHVSYHTQGEISIAGTIAVGLAKETRQFAGQRELPPEVLEIQPSVAGTLSLVNGRELYFDPTENLAPNTAYTALVDLQKLFPDIAPEYRKFTFAFKTIAPNYKVSMGNLQSYSKNWQYLEGVIQASDILPFDKVKQIVKVKQGGKDLNLMWDAVDGDASYFAFKIDSISRKENDSELDISWDGGLLGIDQSGSNTFTIPGLSKFIVIDAKTSVGTNAMLTLNFSEPLEPSQDFNGLVSIENSQDPRFEVDGNVLRVYPTSPITGMVTVSVHNGIKSAYGFRIKEPFTARLSFEQLKPEVRLVSKGTILPNATSTPLYFETVNLSAVEVRVIQIYQDNMLQFLQYNDLGPATGSDIRPVGRRVAYKVLPLMDPNDPDAGNWKAHALDLSELIKAQPGALYRVEFSFKKEHSLYTCNDTAPTESNDDEDYVDDQYYDDYHYDDESYADTQMDEDEAIREERYWDNEIYYWRKHTYSWKHQNDPCHPAYYNQDRIAMTNLLGSDLGLIVKKGNNQSYKFITTDLNTGQPRPQSTVDLYNFQQQKIGSVTTDQEGFATFDANKNLAFAVAKSNQDHAYVKMADGNALSVSKFEVDGLEKQKGLQGFIYTERGVHRPGDPVHLTFVLNDTDNPLPADHPVVLEVTDARGKLCHRQVLSETKSVGGKHLNKFYYFPITTKENDPTGNWTAKITVGGAQFTKALKVATVKPNRLKIDLSFDEEVLYANRNNTGKIIAKWLHGAPAKNLKIDINATLEKEPLPFPEYPKYGFNDPIRDFGTTEIQLFNGTLSNNGELELSQNLKVGQQVPGMLKAIFTTKVFEEGGDFSMDVYGKKLAPYTHFVGLRSPAPKRYGSYDTDADNSFDLVSLSPTGKPAANREITVQLFKIEWRWWWNRSNDNLSRYENAKVHRPYRTFKVTTNANGKAQFKVNIPDQDGGRYLIRALDVESGHATGNIAYFYTNWWKLASNGDQESSKILFFSTDKEKYEVGETAKFTFPSDLGARALISVENGSEVIQSFWVNTQQGQTTTEISVGPEMAPNAYVHITLLQPHGQTKNDKPIRMYGIVPILVEDPETILNPQIELPKVLEPEETYSISISEKTGKPMTYTLAVVDEGLLDLTRYATPRIHDAFYAKQALGVKTFDVFDDVIGSYAIGVDNIYAIGGGALAAAAKNKKAQRFKPVVSFLGPFELKPGERADHKLKMPNYIGAVRVMVVAGEKRGAYGHADTTVPVRKPLMVLTSVPRKLSPGEKVVIPVTVFAMEKKVKNVTVNIKTGKALEPLQGTSKQIQFSEVGEKIVNFEFMVNSTTEVQDISVTAVSGGEKASSSIEIDVENPNPITVKSTLHTLEPGQELKIAAVPFGTLGTNTAQLECTTLPPLDLSGRLNYLIRYPHGCAEQTTSAVFPQLYVQDIMDISYERQREMVANIEAGIKRLGDFQHFSGGLAYWPGSRDVSDWATNYAGHFMLEAKQKGYALPLTFLANWLKYQKNAARQWNGHGTPYNDDTVQAYRLFTLALAQQPELAAMNRLRESGTLSNTAKWRLAAAYALVGRNQVAQDLAKQANIDFMPNKYDYRTYGSVFRNRAMALETMVLLNDPKQRDISEGLAKNLASSNWYSTQETAFALVSLSKMVIKNGGKSIDLSYTDQGKASTIKTEKAMAQRTLRQAAQELTIKNNKDNLIYINLVQSGKLPVGEEIPQSEKLSLNVSYQNTAGQPLPIDELRQGTEFKIVATVYNQTADDVEHIALTQIVPSGWEIVNTSYTDAPSGNGQADYVDIRDDRVNSYFNLRGRETKTFTIQLNASFLGKYYLPGSQAEAMYDHSYRARNKGKWVTVIN